MLELIRRFHEIFHFLGLFLDGNFGKSKQTWLEKSEKKISKEIATSMVWLAPTKHKITVKSIVTF